MAEYAHAYGGLPDPSTPWPLFLALADRASRFAARAKLATLEGVSGGIGLAFDPRGAMNSARDTLAKIAYPDMDSGPRYAEPRPARRAKPDG